MEDKNILLEEPTNGKTPLKAVNIIDTEKGIKKDKRDIGEIRTTSPRIAHALVLNMAAYRITDFYLLKDLKKEDLKKVVPNITNIDNVLTYDSINEILSLDREQGVDRKGKIFYYDNMETKVIYALCYLMSGELEEKDIKKFLEDKKSPYPEKRDQASPIARTISLTELTKIVYYGSSRDTEKAKVLKCLEKIDRRKQIHRYDIHYKGDVISVLDSGHIITTRIQLVVKENEKGNPVIIGDKVVLTFHSPIFFEGGYYTPLTRELFNPKVWKSTELFSTLLNMLTEKYPQYTNKAEGMIKSIRNQVRREGRVDREKIEEEIKDRVQEQLTYTIPFIKIKNRTPLDYSKKQYKARFLKDLEKALDSLIKWGIITEDSTINSSKEQVIVIYNMSYRKGRLTESLQDSKREEEFIPILPIQEE